MTTLREELDARLAEFDLRSAAAHTRTDAVIDAWKHGDAVSPARPMARLRSFFRRDHCEFG